MIFLLLDYVFEMKKDLFIFNQFSNNWWALWKNLSASNSWC